MATTIKLLSTYPNPAGGYYTPGTIISVDDAVAAQLIPVGATTDLTGGVVPSLSASSPSAAAVKAPSGSRGTRVAQIGDSLTAFGNVGPNLTLTAVGTKATAVIANPTGSTGHGQIAGQRFGIHLTGQGGTPVIREYEGVFTVDRVVDANTFEFTLSRAPSNSATTTGQSLFSRALTSVSWFSWANSFLNSPFTLVLNAGIGGNTSSQVRERFVTDLEPSAPDVVTIMAGTNDLRYADANNAVAMAAARDLAFENLKACCEMALSRGWTPVLFGVSAVSTAQAGFAAVTQQIVLLNELLRGYAQRRNVLFVDTYAAIVDSAQADGRAVAAAMLDDVHYKILAAYLIGRAAAPVLAKIAPPARALIASNAQAGAGKSSRLTNPMMTATAGAAGTNASGVFATNWTGSASAATASLVGSVVARNTADGDSDNRGFKQRAVMTFANNGENANLRTTLTISDFAAGDSVGAEFVLKAYSATNIQYLLITLNVTVAGVSQPIYLFSGSDKGWVNGETVGPLAMRTLTFRLPANASGALLSFQAGATGAGGITIEVSQPAIFKEV